MRDRLGGCMRAMRGAEGVVDVEVASVGQLASELMVVLRLARVEARVLENGDARIVHERAQMLFDRLQRERRVLPLRPAQVRAEAELLHAAVEEEPDRRQSCADTRVIGNPPVFERDVEVHPCQDVLAEDIGVPDRARPVHGQSRRCDRSTSRQL